MGHRDVRNLLRRRKKMTKGQIAFERRDVERVASFARRKRGERYSRNIACKNFARAKAGVQSLRQGTRTDHASAGYRDWLGVNQ